ncbi:hypothetical protein EHQ58_10095 [Leptospira ognonensis]|uniref:Replication protein n=1 Tax=Leptospira ognonensis TaxID=2484945 RepID=A0A4R9JZ74_9LEPT|nr:hypothetical protein [Leptospira ognonensis]TGL58662.1 hypothetical protein EHQ58_10095 [Leptospira ognonensis]
MITSKYKINKKNVRDIACRWDKLSKIQFENIDPLLTCRYKAERITWNKFKEFIYELDILYKSINYHAYAITIKRGQRNADLKEMKEALRIALKDFNRIHFQNTIAGMELPFFTFEGNAIDGSYNPHLHCAIWIPTRYRIQLRSHIEDSILNRLAKFKKRKITFEDRDGLHVWMAKLKGEIKKYLGYCARKEDETKGMNFDKIVWELCSFGFNSEARHKMSKRIYRRIESKFPQVKRDSSIRHKVFVMLNWIHKRKYPGKMLRSFLPILSTDTPIANRPRSRIPIREILIKDYEKKYKLKFNCCLFILKKKKQGARV